jgi:hypothetical protein
MRTKKFWILRFKERTSFTKLFKLGTKKMFRIRASGLFGGFFWPVWSVVFSCFFLLLGVVLFDEVRGNYLWSFVDKYISEINSIVIFGLPIFGSQTSYMLF